MHISILYTAIDKRTIINKSNHLTTHWTKMRIKPFRNTGTHTLTGELSICVVSCTSIITGGTWNSSTCSSTGGSMNELNLRRLSWFMTVSGSCSFSHTACCSNIEICTVQMLEIGRKFLELLQKTQPASF